MIFHDAVQIKHTDAENQIVLSWTWFNNQARNKTQVTQDRLGYLPSINAAATDMLMIYEILYQAMKIARKLGIMVICVFDQALYASHCRNITES